MALSLLNPPSSPRSQSREIEPRIKARGNATSDGADAAAALGRTKTSFLEMVSSFTRVRVSISS